MSEASAHDRASASEPGVDGPGAQSQGSAAWTRGEGVNAVAAEVVAYLGRHWEDGWNGEDTDLIVEPFAPGITFTSPFVPRISGDPSVTSIVGFDAVRQYVADSFVRATPGIRYTLDQAYASSDTVLLLYTVHHPTNGDLPGADTMWLGPDGSVVEWRSYYPFS